MVLFNSIKYTIEFALSTKKNAPVFVQLRVKIKNRSLYIKLLLRKNMENLAY